MFHNNSNYAYDNLLHTNIAGIEMQTPVLVASGTFGFGEEFADFVDLAELWLKGQRFYRSAGMMVFGSQRRRREC